MQSLKFILLLFVALTFKNSYSHVLWIETASSGKIQQSQSIKVYYGEYALQQREPIADWYADVSQFDLYLLGPDQQTVKLEKTAHANYFEASFTPTRKGTYVVYVLHPANEPYKSTAFEFSSISYIQVGKSSTSSLDLPLYIEALATPVADSSPVSARVFYNQKPLANADVEVVAPEGWSKKLRTDTKGVIQFQPSQKGPYFLEVSHVEEGERDWFGRSVNKVWKASSTLMFAY